MSSAATTSIAKRTGTARLSESEVGRSRRSRPGPRREVVVLPEPMRTRDRDLDPQVGTVDDAAVEGRPVGGRHGGGCPAGIASVHLSLRSRDGTQVGGRLGHPVGVNHRGDHAQRRTDEDEDAHHGDREQDRRALFHRPPHRDTSSSSAATASACSWGAVIPSSRPPGPSTRPVTVTRISPPPRVTCTRLPGGATSSPRATADASSSPRARARAVSRAASTARTWADATASSQTRPIATATSRGSTMASSAVAAPRSPRPPPPVIGSRDAEEAEHVVVEKRERLVAEASGEHLVEQPGQAGTGGGADGVLGGGDAPLVGAAGGVVHGTPSGRGRGAARDSNSAGQDP